MQHFRLFSTSEGAGLSRTYCINGSCTAGDHRQHCRNPQHFPVTNTAGYAGWPWSFHGIFVGTKKDDSDEEKCSFLSFSISFHAFFFFFFWYKECISFNAGKQDYLDLFIVYVLPLFFFPYPFVQRRRTINRKWDTEEECCFYLATSMIPICCN